ncbi:hypothetical protein ABPG75_008012 [Micractinium tetrahymenae]
MQGLRPYTQDENALAGLHRPAALKAAPLGGEPGLGGLGAKKAAGFPLPGARKALGNITNRGGFDPENTAPGKTPVAGAAPAPPRRALGDITNSNAAAPASLRRTAQKPAAAQPEAQQTAAAAAAAVAQPRSRLDELAEGGVERLAGRGWEALERDRLAREDAEIQGRLAALASYPARPLPNFFPLWGAGGMERALKKDVLPTPPASPAKQTGATAGLGSLAMPDLGDPALALPDVPFPDIDDALSLAGLDGF